MKPSFALIKTSLLDYPGEVCSVIFVRGCNIRCPWCHNPELVNGPVSSEMVGEDEVLSHLTRRRGVLSGVAVSGGEPLFWQDLPEFLERIHEQGLRLKLDTNGTFPERLGRLRPGLVDFVAMDVKMAPRRYHRLGLPGLAPKVEQSVALIRDQYPAHEFRLTWVPGFNDLSDIAPIAAVLGEGERLTVTGFRPGATLDPRFVSRAPTHTELNDLCQRFADLGVDARVRS